MYFWQIQVQQDDIGARRNQIASLVSQKIHGLSSVGNHVQTRRRIDFSQNLPHQPDVAFIVFYQQNVYRHFVALNDHSERKRRGTNSERDQSRTTVLYWKGILL